MELSLDLNFLLRKILFALCCCALVQSRLAATQVQPIAMDRVGGSLYVLSADGSVATLPKGESTFRQIFSIPEDLIGSDLVSAEIGGNVWLIVVAHSRTGNGGRVLKYTLDGKLEKSWDLKVSSINADIDPRAKRLYFSTGPSGEIYVLDLTADRAPESVIKLPNIGNLGPIIFSQTRELFAADIFAGKVYEINLDSRRISVFQAQLGQVISMALEPSGKILLLVDSANNRLLTFDIKTHRITRVLTFPELTQITTVAFGYDQTLWIGDFRSKAVYVVSPRGQIISRLGQLSVQVFMSDVDDDLKFIVDGAEVAAWSKDGSTPRTISLGYGSHSIELRVFNQRSYTGGIAFLGGHIPEGWRYKCKVVDPDGRELVALSDGEDRPAESGPHFGREFTVARFSMDVSTTGVVSVKNIDAAVWRH